MVLHLILDNIDKQTETAFKMMCVSECLNYKEKIKQLIEESTLTWLVSEKGKENEEVVGNGIDFSRD